VAMERRVAFYAMTSRDSLVNSTPAKTATMLFAISVALIHMN
jgi:hypothetical protein